MKRKLAQLNSVFSLEILTYSKAKKTTLIEAAIAVAPTLGIDEENIVKHLTDEMLKKIELECSGLKLIKQEHRKFDNLSGFFDGND